MADYSALDRLLHRLALASPMRAEMLHDVERSLYLSSAPADEGRHVFVCGLARAGTTILMRELHRSGAFGSLTYADMPFVLAPNLWCRLSARGVDPGPRAERAHGDGIEVDQNSPEALDEVYWRVFAGDDYIRPDRLVPHRPDDDAISGYRDLIRLILRRTGKARYLAKNNNHILRLDALAAAFPDSLFLVPVRAPAAHARSLHSQHRRFAESDPFTQSYMRWLGHHEFGATHRSFAWNGAAAGGDPNTPDYWLAQWIAAHRVLLKAANAHDNVRLVPSDRLARDPALWPAVARSAGIHPAPLQEIRALPERADGVTNPEADGLYAALMELAEERLARPGPFFPAAG